MVVFRFQIKNLPAMRRPRNSKRKGLRDIVLLLPVSATVRSDFKFTNFYRKNSFDIYVEKTTN